MPAALAPYIPPRLPASSSGHPSACWSPGFPALCPVLPSQPVLPTSPPAGSLPFLCAPSLSRGSQPPSSLLTTHSLTHSLTLAGSRHPPAPHRLCRGLSIPRLSPDLSGSVSASLGLPLSLSVAAPSLSHCQPPRPTPPLPAEPPAASSSSRAARSSHLSAQSRPAPAAVPTTGWEGAGPAPARPALCHTHPAERGAPSARISAPTDAPP